MRVQLVNLPWALVDVPSLALGILRRVVTGADPGAEVQVVHANLDWIDWLAQRRPVTAADYQFFALDSYFQGVGDWVFAGALHGRTDWRADELARAAPMTEEQRATALDLHRLAPEFVAELAGRLVAAEPDVIGFTSTFQQNLPALAVAAAVKRLDPRVRTVIGGANCDGPQGAAVHRNFPAVDFVLRGEGEVGFPALLAALRPDGAGEDGPLATIPGLCWRGPDGTPTANPMSAAPLAPAQIVGPDYDGYFERREESVAHTWADPKLVVEGARGCWWGEKHHCTFCGLNGSSMEFRSKDPQAYWAEIEELVRRHQVLDMFVVDNILDMGYLRSLLPRIVESDYDLRIQYEIKSNMRRGQLGLLADAGIVSVQPGIESLSSPVLTIMRKGVTGCQNVRMLRDAASAGLSVAWNYLYGFPGESDQDYLPILAQLPALHHLPPAGGANRIVVERFSPYFDRPELGFDPLRPARQYALNYDLPEDELRELAYLFESPPRGIDDAVAGQLDAAMTRWQDEFADSVLGQIDLGEEILLVSRRSGFAWRTLRLTGAGPVAAFRLLADPHTEPALHRKLTAAGHPVDADELRALLGSWLAHGLLFTESGHYVHVAPEARNQELMHIRPVHPQQPAATDPRLTGSLR